MFKSASASNVIAIHEHPENNCEEAELKSRLRELAALSTSQKKFNFIALPEPATKFLILDHDSMYGAEVRVAIRSMSLRAVRTAVGCPSQSGVAERWVGSCRRELLDHVIAINESHLKRLLASYVDQIVLILTPPE